MAYRWLKNEDDADLRGLGGKRGNRSSSEGWRLDDAKIADLFTTI